MENEFGTLSVDLDFGEVFQVEGYPLQPLVVVAYEEVFLESPIRPKVVSAW
jgi:hypothetical protein